MTGKIEQHLRELSGWKRDQIFSEYEFDAFRKLYDQLAAEHERLRSRGGSAETILLTARTRELQELVRSYANDDRAFLDAKTYKRVY